MYQDTWIDGEIVEVGSRECADRYQAVSNILKRFKRKFTMLDFGADRGYFSFRASNEFPCVAVMIQDGNGLGELCEENSQCSDTILLQKRFGLKDLEALSECEHFDVVLALSVLHHFSGVDPQKLVDVVCSLGDIVIIESPTILDVNACGQDSIEGLMGVLTMMGNVKWMLDSPSHTTPIAPRPMFIHRKKKTTLQKPYIGIQPGIPFSGMRIESTLSRKTVSIKGEKRDWIAGINLNTYKVMGGVHPKPSTVASWVEKLDIEDRHGDVAMWNIILAGRDISLIDKGGDREIVDDDKGIANVAHMLTGQGEFTTSRRVKAIDFGSKWLPRRCENMSVDVKMRRKIWEWCSIAQVYTDEIGLGGKVLGFGVGKEPLPSFFLANGCDVVATDQYPDRVKRSWRLDNIHASSLDDLTGDVEGVRFTFSDMNELDTELTRDFDLTWSSGSLEHLGSLAAGMVFFCKQMDCLKKGGIAAHTTEFNCSSNEATLTASDLVLYRDRDFRLLEKMLSDQGDFLYPLDLSPGTEPEDLFISKPPYSEQVHLIIQASGHVTTSVVLIAKRGAR